MKDHELAMTPTPLGPGEHHSATLATFSIGLCDRVDAPGELTTELELLIRPHRLVSDESGEHPGEAFYELRLTREQLHALARIADRDWRAHRRATTQPPDVARWRQARQMQQAGLSLLQIGLELEPPCAASVVWLGLQRLTRWEEKQRRWGLAGAAP